MNQTSKPWYLSKGFVGPLVTAILYALRSTGVADIDTDSALGILYQGAKFMGLVVGMAGRAMARTKLTSGMEAVTRSTDRHPLPRDGATENVIR